MKSLGLFAVLSFIGKQQAENQHIAGILLVNSEIVILDKRKFQVTRIVGYCEIFFYFFAFST